MADNKVLKGINFPGLEGTYYVPEAKAVKDENGYIEIQSYISDTVEVENLDATLTKEGYAADAKAVGEALKPYIIPIDGQGDGNYVFASGFTFNQSELLNIYHSDRTMIVRVFYDFKNYPYDFKDYQCLKDSNPEDEELMYFQHLDGTECAQIELHIDGQFYFYNNYYATSNQIDDINENIYIKKTYEELYIDTAYDMASDDENFVFACQTGFYRGIDRNDFNKVYSDDEAAQGPKKIICNNSGIYVAISIDHGYVYFSFNKGESFTRYDGLSGQGLTSIVSTGNNEYAILLNDGRIALLHNPVLQDDGSLSVTHEFDQGAPEEVLTGEEILLYCNQLYAIHSSGSIHYQEDGFWNSGVNGVINSPISDAIVYQNFIVSVGEFGLNLFNTDNNSVKSIRYASTRFNNARLDVSEENGWIVIISDEWLEFLYNINPENETYYFISRKGRFDYSDDKHWNRVILKNYNSVYALKNYSNNINWFYTFSQYDDFADFSIRQSGFDAYSDWSATNKRLRASIEAAPKYTYGTEDLEPGVTKLETGTLHFVYE